MFSIDLHVHSTVSDGTFTPKQVALYAAAKSLYCIALTDHDTTDGVKECQQYAKEVGVEVISGVEISAGYKEREIHMLAYFIDIENEQLKKTLHKISTERKERNLKIIDKLNEIGLEISYQDLNPEDKNISITRGNIARALLQKGYISNIEEAFKKYIGKNGPAYVSREYVDYTECIDVIHQAGGLAVVAHPYLYKLDTPTFIADLKQAGLDGIEVIYPEHTSEMQEMYFKLCKQYDLFVTGGSDFHGGNKPSIDMGNGFGKTIVHMDLLTNMKARLQKK
ncbi:MAG: hypothetical protein BEN19_05710 [Epulopiscium sp. Nuni2H_MBin003]|nr:MAG: hypothetical protein BEN19_05710 [Epulopiscium sp. Nuni2H_MBin003]